MSKGKSTVQIDMDMDIVSRWAETFTSAEFISKQKGALARAMKPIVNDYQWSHHWKGTERTTQA